MMRLNAGLILCLLGCLLTYPLAAQNHVSRSVAVQRATSIELADVIDRDALARINAPARYEAPIVVQIRRSALSKELVAIALRSAARIKAEATHARVEISVYIPQATRLPSVKDEERSLVDRVYSELRGASLGRRIPVN